MMPVPNFTPSPTPPTTPGTPYDLWFDQTNGVLNIWTTINTVTGRQGWMPITNPANPVALNASVVSVGAGGFTYIPALVGSLGASLPNIPAGQVAMAYDVVGKRIYLVASGGLVAGSVLFA